MIDSKGSETDLVIGLILGALVGVFLGFAYTSRLDAETRKLLREKAGVSEEKMLEVGDGA